jgi:hypothetical protein
MSHAACDCPTTLMRVGVWSRFWEVIHRFDSHEEAAAWHSKQPLPLPANCIVPGNKALPYDATSGLRAADQRRFHLEVGPEVAVQHWDAEYARRAGECGVFLVCQPLFCELNSPPILNADCMRRIFKRIPGTQNPPRISAEEYAALEAIARQRRQNAISSPAPCR